MLYNAGRIHSQAKSPLYCFLQFEAKKTKLMRGKSLFGNGTLHILYDEAGLSAKIRRSLNLMIVGHVFGSAYNIICSGGTTAMIGLATELGVNDMIFGILSAIVQVAALSQLPLSILVNRKQHRKKYMMILGSKKSANWDAFA